MQQAQTTETINVDNLTDAEAKRELRKRLLASSGGPLSLDQMTCKLVLKAGGPTFRPNGRGFICNQTGHKIPEGRRNCGNFASRISGTAVGAKKKRGKKLDQPVMANGPQPIKTVAYRRYASGFLLYCPYCGCSSRSEKDFPDFMTCGHCGRQMHTQY